MSKRTEINVAGKTLTVSNLEKVLYPEVGFTKGQVIDYYIRIAPVLLPHLKGRPITLKRYPEGVNGFFFYEKRCPSHRPPWVKTAAVPSRREEKRIDYCVMDDLPALIWAANLADLELHTFLHRAPAITRPTTVAFDLDPGPPADIVLCCKVGLWLKEMFESLNLQSFPKTSGSKGLQVFVPLNTATTYDRTKDFARALAERLEREHPNFVVSRMQKALRKGKVLIDWSQNDEHKTTINVYSLRAKSRPTVSTPVTWKEVEITVKKAEAQLLVFDSRAALRRVEKHGDLFDPVLRLKQRLPKLETVAILPFRNCAFKIGIRYRMVLDLNGEMLLAVSVRQTLGQRPGFECSIHFKPQIVVQPGSIMLLDDKRVRRSLADFGRGLGRLFEVPLTSVFLE